MSNVPIPTYLVEIECYAHYLTMVDTCCSCTHYLLRGNEDVHALIRYEGV